MTVKTLILFASSASLIAGPFTIGPDYECPTVEAPDRFKAEDLGRWKVGKPADHLPKESWWEVFGVSTLSELERLALDANQEL